jgi:RsiW-degrading membrane proteinase PrsW (M82 family)
MQPRPFYRWKTFWLGMLFFPALVWTEWESFTGETRLAAAVVTFVCVLFFLWLCCLAWKWSRQKRADVSRP